MYDTVNPCSKHDLTRNLNIFPRPFLSKNGDKITTNTEQSSHISACKYPNIDKYDTMKP